MHLSHSSVSVRRIQTRFLAIFNGYRHGFDVAFVWDQKSLYIFGYKFDQGSLKKQRKK